MCWLVQRGEGKHLSPLYAQQIQSDPPKNTCKCTLLQCIVYFSPMLEQLLSILYNNLQPLKFVRVAFGHGVWRYCTALWEAVFCRWAPIYWQMPRLGGNGGHGEGRSAGRCAE